MSKTIVDIQGVLKEIQRYSNDFFKRREVTDGDTDPDYTHDGHFLGKVRDMSVVYEHKTQVIYHYESFENDGKVKYVYIDGKNKLYRKFFFTSSDATELEILPEGYTEADVLWLAIRKDYLSLAHKEFLFYYLSDQDLEDHQVRIYDFYNRAYSYFKNGENLEHSVAMSYYQMDTSSINIKLANDVTVRVSRKSRIYPEHAVTVSQLNFWRKSPVNIPLKNGTRFEIHPSNLTFNVFSHDEDPVTTRDIVYSDKYKDMILSVFRHPQEFFGNEIFDERYANIALDYDTEHPGTPG